MKGLSTASVNVDSFWNLLIDQPLFFLEHKGQKLLVYTVNFVTLVNGKHNNVARGGIQQALNLITR